MSRTLPLFYRKFQVEDMRWSGRSLADEPIGRLILDGKVVRVRLDREAAALLLAEVVFCSPVFRGKRSMRHSGALDGQKHGRRHWTISASPGQHVDRTFGNQFIAAGASRKKGASPNGGEVNPRYFSTNCTSKSSAARSILALLIYEGNCI